ncbi:hypothetical protein RUM44_006483 [Polyplax serrata]|uniref:Dynein axonemal intermediate chain 4 n=1 Tax=Polyplax serrata TaxID=468196 RepID=A0ABR1AI75_POLSC
MEENTEEEQKAEEAKSEPPLHNIFLDLSLENDLKGSELEWFKSRIFLDNFPKKKKKEEKAQAAKRKVEIVREDARPTEKPNTLYLRLSETETIWLFSLDTLYSENNPIDAEKVRKDNETYQMKKTKKELIRKRCMADAQTPRNMEKSQGTETEEIQKADAEIFASEWDLYDTYNSIDECQLQSPVKCLKSADFGESSKESGEEKGVATCEKTSEEPLKSLNFKYATLVTERLLASNCYENEQSVFKRKFISRYDETPTNFSYELKPLWNFKKDFKYALMVTDLDWNPLNQDLLAVGYGNLKFLRKTPGVVCIWSPKNPRQPEREFFFEESVTSLNYSKLRPNILAVGTRRGKIYVLDASSHTGEPRLLKSDDSKPRPEPIWKVQWYQHKELVFEKEEILAVGESGVLMLFSFPSDVLATGTGRGNVLKLDYVVSKETFLEKKVGGKVVQWEQMDDVIYDRKTFSGLSFSIFSNRNFCYVSTKEGVLVKCNMRNPSMTTGVFPAHDGPIYVVTHSPVTDLIYFTCGADWTIKIWMEGIKQPLLNLQNKAPVRCARWSPTIPTIIAAVSDAQLSIWDIARNILFPVSTTNFEDCGKPFSTVLFSTNGMSCPQSQFYTDLNWQKEALVTAIRNGLYRNKVMIGPFERAVELNREKLRTEVVV